MESTVPQLLLQLILIALNAIFACAETAFLSMNDAKLSQLEQKKAKKINKLKKLTARPEKFLATIQVAITLAGFIGSAFAADNFSDDLVNLINKTGVNLPFSEATIHSISMVIITLILSFLTILFGELIPKRLAMKKPEKLAVSLIPVITFISILFAPLVWLLTASTNGILRLFGINPKDDEEKVTEEEIRLMVDAGSEDGSIEQEEKEIIQNVFEFNDTTAGEIATHRTDMIMLCKEDTPDHWAEIIHNSRHSLFPIYTETMDKIVGVINAKDYFRLEDKSIESIFEKAVKEPYLVPDTVSADVLLRNMRARKEYFAIVVDEYGGTQGIVTLSDLIQCIVGDITYDDGDNSEPELPEIEQIDDVTYNVCGLMLISDFEKAVGRELSDLDCDTVSGYILSVIGSIPQDGTTLTTENEIMSINVTEVKDHRIERAIITLKPLEPKEE